MMKAILLLFMIESSQAFTFFDRHAEGWHWYEVIPHENDSVQDESVPQTPSEMIEQQKRELEQSLHKAVISGNPRDVMSYINKQQALMNQSLRFAQAWQVAILTHPELDERIQYPTEQFSHDTYYKLKQDKRSQLISTLAQEYGLFFFFKGNCSYCHVFAPVVKGFAEVYGWEVLPISLDGGSLESFPNPQHDNGIVRELGVQHVPALIAVHPQSKRMIPLAYGVASFEEIERRVEMLLTFEGENQ